MRNEWPTVAMMGLCYGVWFAAGLYIWPTYPIICLLVMSVTAALHSSLQHETLHGHPTNKAWINELLVGILPLAPAYPFRRFKALHLRHHHDERLTDPYDDPESYYMDGRKWDEISAPLKFVLTINNTMLGRVVIGPVLMVWGFIATEIKLAIAGDRKVITAWALHIAGLVVLGAIMQSAFGLPFWLYVLTSGYLGMSIISVRTYCEHQAAGDINHRTVIVENSPLSLLFLNNNLHVAHHSRPALAWYRLPAYYRTERAELIARNDGYMMHGYGEIFRRYFLTAKEPIPHPNMDWLKRDMT